MIVDGNVLLLSCPECGAQHPHFEFYGDTDMATDGLWSAGDTKIVAPDSQVLALANNRDATVIQAELDLSRAGRRYAREALAQPVFLRRHWQAMLAACQRQLRSA